MSQPGNVAGAALKSIWPHGLRITESSATAETTKNGAAPSLPKFIPTIYASLAAAWKWLEGRRRMQLSSRRLRITETLSLGEKRNLLIVTVDGAQLLIGSSAAGLQLLTTLEAADSQSTVAAKQQREWGS